MSVIYASDSELLTEINSVLADHVDGSAEPDEVDSPAILNLDFATVSQQVWQLLVVFGTVKASIESVELILKLLRERKTRGKTSQVEFTASGVKVTLTGDMTPEEVAAEVKRYESAFLETGEASTP
jgi:hypothetical protein